MKIQNTKARILRIQRPIIYRYILLIKNDFKKMQYKYLSS